MIIFLLVSFFFTESTQAATLYLSPSSGSYAVGRTISVSVYISSTDAAVNALSGIIGFPSDKLEVTALNKGGTINLWVQEPSFSNTAGTVNFEGVILNPGFTGSSGKILTIVFRAKSVGSASLSFSSGAALANDGQGTNILSGLGSATFSLESGNGDSTPAQPTTPAQPATQPSSGLPAAPNITSGTHPDQNKWYPGTTAQFNWTLPSNVTAVRLLADKNAQSLPSVSYTPPIDVKELADLTDGVWYLHVRFRNAAGWGPVTHFRFQIDTAPPGPFSIKFADGPETNNPRPVASFSATDALSGIDHYRLKIGDNEFYNVSPNTNNEYELPLQPPGKQTLLVQAHDRAGNYSTAMEEFTILPIKGPLFTEYPERISSSEFLEAKGTSPINAKVTVWLKKDADEAFSQDVKSDADGNFHFVAKKRLSDGVYKMWAVATAENGAQSNPSDEKVITVTVPLQLRLGKIFIDYITVINALIVMVLGLMFLAAYAWYKVALWRRRVRKETREAERRLHQAFSALSQEVKSQVSKLDGHKGLSVRERIIYERLKRALHVSERIVSKEIEDIDDHLEK